MRDFESNIGAGDELLVSGGISKEGAAKQVSKAGEIDDPIETTGGSLIPVTVKVAGSLSDKPPGSVAVKVMVSLPFQLVLATVMVTNRAGLIDTLRPVFPL